VIIEEADRLNRLVTDMLTLSKIQAGVGLLDITEFNLSETISRVVQPYAEIMREEGYTIETSLEDSLWIRADQARIKQVISNLLSNAIKYCGKDKIVFVRGFLKGEYVRFEVEDQGMGIRKEDLTQIWERYQKGSTNHVRHTSGTGLGLSIVKEILTLHKAEFGVKSHLGEGALFWFELPRM
jgi:signal transduction histidine kinase